MAGRTVMVIDADDAICDLLDAVLSEEGYDAHCYVESTRAWEELAQHRVEPDLLLLGWMMPGINGGKFRARQLAEPTLATIPAILLTTTSVQHLNTRGVPFDVIVSEPFDLEVLLAIIERFCL